ncbi:MAG: ABC transporter ATP-binding protein [Acidimicrobiales bacterium]|nr:ABC transporter ATP-binding protein [Acidimicrobiales bacterium]
MRTSSLRCTGLTKRFASGTALDGLTLDAEPGEVVALLGPNGAGKTTTIRLLNGVLGADEGSATVLGLDPWTQGTELRRRTGVLTENAGLDERFTALENLMSTAELRGIDRSEGRRRGGELLERFGMGHRADAKVQGFSTGQRKRVALARSLLHDPELLYLDEPTSGLDPAATRDVVDLIATLASERGRTVILCTHFLGEAGKLASRMAVLFQGRMHAFGTPEELASELWTDTEVSIGLAAPAPPELLAALSALPEVVQAVPTPDGLLVRVRSVDATPNLVRACVSAGVDVLAVTPRYPTLEDVYFAVEARAQAAGLDDGLGARPVAS